jgi:hypothetical protein
MSRAVRRSAENGGKSPPQSTASSGESDGVLRIEVDDLTNIPCTHIVSQQEFDLEYHSVCLFIVRHGVRTYASPLQVADFNYSDEDDIAICILSLNDHEGVWIRESHSPVYIILAKSEREFELLRSTAPELSFTVLFNRLNQLPKLYIEGWGNEIAPPSTRGGHGRRNPSIPLHTPRIKIPFEENKLVNCSTRKFFSGQLNTVPCWYGVQELLAVAEYGMHFPIFLNTLLDMCQFMNIGLRVSYGTSVPYDYNLTGNFVLTLTIVSEDDSLEYSISAGSAFSTTEPEGPLIDTASLGEWLDSLGDFDEYDGKSYVPRREM